MRTEGKASILIIFIICIILALIAGGIFMLYYGENVQYLKIAQGIQDEYSVPVNIKVINESGKYIPFIVPEKVRWDKGHEKLLYNLSNPKETVLAYVEALSSYDYGALEILMTPTTRGYWARIGYSHEQVLRSYRSHYKGYEKPYRYEVEEGEGDPSEGMLTVIITGESDSDELGLTMQPDGTWRI
jgi:hypothetical protein